MRKNKKEKRLRCVVYLATRGNLNRTMEKEKKQLRGITEYAKAHNIEMIDIYHSSGMGQYEVNRQFDQLVRMVEMKQVDGILIKNMQAVSLNITDAYFKIGKVRNAGGYIVTVDEGELHFKLTMGG